MYQERYSKARTFRALHMWDRIYILSSEIKSQSNTKKKKKAVRGLHENLDSVLNVGRSLVFQNQDL
jgi:hypothetical protein